MKHLNTNNRISEEDYDAMLNEVTPDLDIPSCWSNLKMMNTPQHMLQYLKSLLGFMRLVGTLIYNPTH